MSVVIPTNLVMQCHQWIVIRVRY